MDEVLKKLNIHDLEKLWVEVVSQSPIRADFIQKLDVELQAVEKERAHLVRARNQFLSHKCDKKIKEKVTF